MKVKNKAVFYAILAAALYAIHVPIAKMLLKHAEPTMMAAFLYLGAGIGVCLYGVFRKKKDQSTDKITKKEWPYVVGMVVLDIIAPILLMLGITMTSSANVSLLNNFEIVATSVIALMIFKEAISKKLWFAILFITVASVVLGFEDISAFTFNKGSLLVLGACLCWGLENNCTKMLSQRSPVAIVVIKGIFSGLGSLVIAWMIREQMPAIEWIVCILVLGFVAYGLSIYFYIKAQKYLGAAKTSAFYSVAPFLGVVFSMLLLWERPKVQFYVALLIMVIGVVFVIKDTKECKHT